jgi:hypothetical protein
MARPFFEIEGIAVKFSAKMGNTSGQNNSELLYYSQTNGMLKA